MTNNTTLLILCTHGTYGRYDDTYGALQAANTALAKGIHTSLLLLEDAVLMTKQHQNPNDIGLPNNLPELQDFIELGGTLKIHKESLKERGLTQQDLIPQTQLINTQEIPNEINNHQIFLTF